MQLRRAGEVLGALSRGSDYDSFFIAWVLPVIVRNICGGLRGEYEI